METEDSVTKRMKEENCQALLLNMGELYSQNEFFDVTLQVENRSFKCHQFVLAAFSKYFHRMFGSNFKEKNIDKEEPIVLHDVNAEAFELILHCVYFGDLDITNSNVCSVLATADFLELKTPYIETKCIEFIRKNIQGPEPLPNAIEIFKFSCVTKKEVLIDLLRKHICQHLKEFSTEDTFGNISFEDLKDLLQGYPLWITDQDTVLTFIIGWVHQSRKERKHYFTELIKLPDLQKISSRCLVLLLNEYEKLLDRIEEEPGRVDDMASFKSLSSPLCSSDNAVQTELTITFAKDNFLALGESERAVSPPYVLQDLSWRILIERKPTRNHLSIFLQCDGHPLDTNWKCFVNFELLILLQETKQLSDHTSLGRKGLIGRAGTDEFDEKHRAWGWTMRWDDVIDPANRFIKDDIVIFQARKITASSPGM